MILSEKLKDYRVILASGSPRRKELLKGLDIKFEVIVREVDETFPAHLIKEQIPLHLAQLKADAFDPSEFGENAIVITADTIVWLEDKMLNKPKNDSDAIEMLSMMSGKVHEVFTGVCIKTNGSIHSFYATSRVKFRRLTVEEIYWYVEHYQPYDKAGAYGIQEWIGFIGIEHVEGSFYNVMGLPTQMLYIELNQLIR